MDSHDVEINWVVFVSFLGVCMSDTELPHTFSGAWKPVILEPAMCLPCLCFLLLGMGQVFSSAQQLSTMVKKVCAQYSIL